MIKYKSGGFTEDLHPRDDAGKFSEGSGGGSGKLESKSTSISIPKTMDDARKLAQVLRDSLEEVVPNKSSQSNCVVASTALQQVIPNSQVYAGEIDTSKGKDDHAVVKMGDFYIDVTTDQYGDGEKINVFQGKLPKQYRDFKPIKDGYQLMETSEEKNSKLITERIKQKLKR